MNEPSAAVGRADAIRGVVFAVGIVIAATAYSFRFTSFLHPKLAVLAVVIVVCAILAVVRGRFSWRGVTAFLPLWMLLAFDALVHLLGAPSHVPHDTALSIARGAMVLLGAATVFDLLAVPKSRERMVQAVTWSAGAVAVLAWAQYLGWARGLFPAFSGYDQRVYSVFGNQDLLGGYVAAGLALAACRFVLGERRRMADLGLAILLLSVLLLSGSRSAWLAAVFGVGVGLAHRDVLRRRKPAMAVAAALIFVTAAVTVFAPAATIDRLAGSFRPDDVGYRVRLWIWDASLRMIADAPILGRGLGTFAYWSPRHMGEALWASGPGGHIQNELHADHAHNDLVELSAETGVIGLLCLAWMLWRLRHCRGPEWGGLAALAIFALFNAGFRSPPHAIAGVILTGALLARRKTAVPLNTSRTAAATILIGTLCAAGIVVWAETLPSMLLRAAEKAHLAGEPCLHLYERVTAYPWPNAMAEKEYGFALAEAGLNGPAQRQLEQALAGLDTGDVYLALALVAEREGDRSRADSWAKECLQRWPGNETAWAIRLRSTATDAGRERLTRESKVWLQPRTSF